MERENSNFYDELERTKKVLANPEKNLPSLILSYTGRLVCKITRRKTPLPWQFNLVILALIIQLPTLAISNILRESEQWAILGFAWMVYIELGLFATMLAHISVLYVYKRMNMFVVDKIQLEENLKDLQQVLARVGSIKNTMYFTLAFTIFWCISFSLVSSIYINKFIGYGLLSGTIIFGLLTGPAIYLEGCYFLFITHIGSYSYELNETAPAHSEVIQRIAKIITVLLYSFAIFIAFSTAAVASNLGAVVLVILIGWIPTIVYFLGSQVSIGRIITSAKWKTLNRIKDQINFLNNGDITEKDDIDTIKRLMDYHERIRATPNSTFTVGTGLNFLNQLALPLLGLLLANIDKVIQLFR